ncbi:MAG TPA: ABC transporter ATP-binding protein [Acidimicrobiia bacterium]|nr:ABC transporter ATP-binding protein [Acidimicrobiia bacterium]
MVTTVPRTDLTAARMTAGVKRYGQGDTAVTALDGIDVSFESGRFTAIMGPSGSGKSTLLHCLAGLDVLTSGSAYIGEVELGSLSDKDLTLLRREKVGFVFQAFNLIPTLSAKENVLLPLLIAGAAHDAAWFGEVVGILGIENRLSHRPNELSGGEQQRVAAARALVSHPAIVFADEPSGNLDSRSAAELLAFMRRAASDYGQTIVMVTHDPVAAAYADRIVFLGDGRIVDEMANPTTEAVIDRMKQFGG